MTNNANNTNNTTEDIKILYEDNHIICAVKPRGALSQADGTGAPDMLTAIKRYLAEKYHKSGAVYLGLVHRLDRPVGGVMVFARTSKAAGRLSAQIRERTIHKTYLAVLRGVPDGLPGGVPDSVPDGIPNGLPGGAAVGGSGRASAGDNGDCGISRGVPYAVPVRLRHRIRKSRFGNLVEVSEYDGPSPDEIGVGIGGGGGGGVGTGIVDPGYAALDYRLLEVSGFGKADGDAATFSLVSVGLITGRPHQIRAQFAHIGHPVVGDRKYGVKHRPKYGTAHSTEYGTAHSVQPQWPALWAVSLAFGHPVRDEIIRVSEPPPREWPWELFKTYEHLTLNTEY